MKITSVSVRKIERRVAHERYNFGITSAFAVHDIRIIEGDNGLLLLC